MASLRAGRLELVAHASVTADPLARAVGSFRRAYPGSACWWRTRPGTRSWCTRSPTGAMNWPWSHCPASGSGPGDGGAGPPRHLAGHGAGHRHRTGTGVAAEVSAMPLVAVLHGGSARHAIRRALAAPDTRRAAGSGRAGTRRAAGTRRTAGSRLRRRTPGPVS
ncbi:hypothetical protein ACFQ3Z_02910 [Streptomyces nogalater]